jgi:glycosyltransferase involved in cell wall biosynthesis
LLKDKESQLLAAAAELHRNDPRVVFLIVGTADPETRTASILFVPDAGDTRAFRQAGRHQGNPCADRCLRESEQLPRRRATHESRSRAGQAVVTSNGPGCRDTVVDGETGFIVPPRDAKALMSALRQLIESDALRARFGAAAREDARKRFSVEAAVDRVAAVYRDALSRT